MTDDRLNEIRESNSKWLVWPNELIEELIKEIERLRSAGTSA